MLRNWWKKHFSGKKISLSCVVNAPIGSNVILGDPEQTSLTETMKVRARRAFTKLGYHPNTKLRFINRQKAKVPDTARLEKQKRRQTRKCSTVKWSDEITVRYKGAVKFSLGKWIKKKKERARLRRKQIPPYFRIQPCFGRFQKDTARQIITTNEKREAGMEFKKNQLFTKRGSCLSGVPVNVRTLTNIFS